MPQRKKIVIFDLDETLLDTSERHYMIYSEITKEFDLIKLSKSSYWSKRKKGNSNLDVLVSQGLESINIPNVLKYWIKSIEIQDHLDLDTPFDYAEYYLNKLNEKYSLWLVTLRTNTKGLYQQIDSLKWDTFFDRIIPVKHTSNNSAGKANEVKVNLKQEDEVLIWIGDSLIDREAAKYINTTFIHIEDLHSALDSLIIN